jgi:opine dehydrogenase
MEIAVLGAGAGGTATAFDCAAHGHSVRLFDFPHFRDNVSAIAREGGIRSEGELEGFQKLSVISHELDPVIDGAELIYVVGPAYSIEHFGTILEGKLGPEQTVVVTPGSSGGALALKKAMGLAPDDYSVTIAETATLHYAVRLTEPACIRVFLKLRAGNFIAALPGDRIDGVVAKVASVYPGMEPAPSVLQTSLQNANPVIHPAVTLANAARIEGTGGDFLFYEDGVSDAVGNLIEAVDRERIAIGAALGITVHPDPVMGIRQGYMFAENYGLAYREAPGFRGIRAQSALDHRYLNEDVGYGLVFFSRLARQVGVATPTIDAIIHLASVLMKRDYAAEALRTPESLGIGGLTAAQLAEL